MARAAPALWAAALVAALACACSSGPTTPAAEDRLTIAAFSVVREAYNRSIFPAFSLAWRARTGRGVRFEASFGASGAQSRAVVEGLEADVVVLSMAEDVERLRKNGLVRHEWSKRPHAGMVTRSIVALGVREGNPKAVRDFDDLARADVSVLTPNPRTSGGATWNVAAIVGAARRRGEREGDVLEAVLRRVDVMDRSGRDAMSTFEHGVGDVVVTYENEIAVGRAAGRRYEQVTPRATIRIDNPVALVDTWADKHGRREIAQAFIDFLLSDDAQRAFVAHGLRPVVPAVERETAARFAPVADLFTIDDLGGFAAMREGVFGDGGSYTAALARAKGVR